MNPDDQNGFVGFRVASAGLSADFDFDTDVDQFDLAEWQAAFGTTSSGDADGDGDSDGADFLIWQRSFSGNTAVLTSRLATVPEPASAILMLLGFALLHRHLRRIEPRLGIVQALR